MAQCQVDLDDVAEKAKEFCVNTAKDLASKNVQYQQKNTAAIVTAHAEGHVRVGRVNLQKIG